MQRNVPESPNRATSGTEVACPWRTANVSCATFRPLMLSVMMLPGEPAPEARTWAVMVASPVPVAVTVADSMKALGEPLRPKLVTKILASVATVLRKLLLSTFSQPLAWRSVRMWISLRRRCSASAAALASSLVSGLPPSPAVAGLRRPREGGSGVARAAAVPALLARRMASRSAGSTLVPTTDSSAWRSAFFTRSRSVVKSRMQGSATSFIRSTAASSPGLRVPSRPTAAWRAWSKRLVPLSRQPIE